MDVVNEALSQACRNCDQGSMKGGGEHAA
jgi:hypothetical protein